MLLLRSEAGGGGEDLAMRRLSLRLKDLQGPVTRVKKKKKTKMKEVTASTVRSPWNVSPHTTYSILDLGLL